MNYSFRGHQRGIPVVFLHGFLGHQEDWGAFLDIFSKDFYCLTVDLPGHGKTPLDETNNSLPKAAEALNALLDQLGVKACHLVGYSMGGRLALQTVLKRPERFVTLTLEGSCPGLKTEEECCLRIAQDGYIARQIEKEKDDFRGYLLKWYEQPFFKSLKKDKRFFEDFLQLRLENDPLMVAGALRALSTGAQPSLWTELGQVLCPVCLIVGANDSKFLKFADDMKEGFPCSQLHVVPDVGHNVHVEKPIEYDRILRSFFRRLTKDEK